jgi:DNA-binding transcriptional LysR family regulator
MDLHRLNLFKAVAESGSVSAAAQLRNISQPALSFHLRELQSELGIALFERKGRGLRITDAGKLLLEKLQPVFASISETERSLQEFRGIARGILRLAASTTPGVYLLPPILGKFHTKFPEIELDLEIANTSRVKDLVLGHELPLGIIGEDPDHEELDSQPFARDELIFITSPRSKTAKLKSISPRAIEKLPFLLREKGSNTRKTYEDLFKKHGVRINPAMELGSTEAIKQAVSANLGVSLVPRIAVKWELASGKLVSVKLKGIKFQRQFRIIRRIDRTLMPAEKAFLGMMI